MNRALKRVTIILIWLLIFSFIVGVLYLIFREKPSCFDGKLNQNEQKIDCGGVCDPCEEEIEIKNLEVISAEAVDGGNGKYDVLVEVKNVNNNFGSSGFEYKISLRGSDGSVLDERSGNSYILPMESKYIIETNFEPNSKPVEVSVELGGNNWEELEIFEEPELNVYNKTYSPLNDNNKSEVYGLLKNESRFDFVNVDLSVILRDGNGRPVAINKSTVSSLLAQQERDFKLVWPYELKYDVMEVEIEADTNVFDSLNYVKEFQSDGKFQEF
jgi:hypothetical protein